MYLWIGRAPAAGRAGADVVDAPRAAGRTGCWRGALDLDQMRAAFLQVGMEPTDEEIAMVLEQLEKSDDGDATFSFAEFSQACDFLAPLE